MIIAIVTEIDYKPTSNIFSELYDWKIMEKDCKKEEKVVLSHGICFKTFGV